MFFFGNEKYLLSLWDKTSKIKKMKKLYTLSLVLFACAASFAQTIYSESFGTTSVSSPFPLVSAYAGYQNSAPIAYDGTADVRGTLVSSGYSGASGANNVFITNTVGKFLQINGLNTSAYASADLVLTFGLNSPNVTAMLVVESSTNGTDWTALTYTHPGSGWKLVTIGNGAIPSSSTLSLRFSQPDPVSGQFRVDDVKLANSSAACALSLGVATTLCDAFTISADTYTATIPFTGGGTATYNLSASAGTIGGDNPSTTASGNIIVSGITEGTALTFTALGGSCNLSVSLLSPHCNAINTLPFSESFNYTPDTAIATTQNWMPLNTGDAITTVAGSLNYTGISSTGNAISFGGAGAEAATKITPVTSGTFYASFLMQVTDLPANTVETSAASTYFAALSSTNTTDYRARIFIKRSGEQFLLGGSNTSAITDEKYSSTLYSVGDTVLIIIGYNFDTNEIKYWFNPTVATFNASTPATLTETPTGTSLIPTLTGFTLRQDAANTTPTMTIDELRMGTTVESVLAVEQNDIAGLKMYPNPVSGGTLYINTNANAEKAVVIYDVLGKTVVNTKTVNSVNVSNLNTGIYIVKITEEGKTATRKLVIK